jgi:hypothetical protein
MSANGATRPVITFLMLHGHLQPRLRLPAGTQILQPLA